jgi:hypothetical protein
MADAPISSDDGAQEVEIVQSATLNRLAISSNGALPPHSDVTGTGTIVALNGAVTVTTNGCGTIVFNVTGTWVATVQLEATTDGTNWFSTLYTTSGTSAVVFVSITGPNTLIVPCGGYEQVRLRASTYASGTVAVAYNTGVGANIMQVISANAASFNNTSTQGGTWTVQPGNTPNTTPWLANPTAANLSVTATGAAAAAVTLTLPAVAAQFHYISSLEIMAYTTVARVGTATPILVTSTNLPGSNVWTFATAAAIGSTDTKYFTFSNPYKSSVVNTATTIVCPATTSVIWRVNVIYYSAT